MNKFHIGKIVVPDQETKTHFLVIEEPARGLAMKSLKELAKKIFDENTRIYCYILTAYDTVEEATSIVEQLREAELLPKLQDLDDGEGELA